MTRDEIIRIFHKAGEAAGWKPDVSALLLNYIMHFAALVAAAEREACAKVCDEKWIHSPEELAAAIRARGQA